MAVIANSKTTGISIASYTDVGSYKFAAHSVEDGGWLICNGQEIDRTLYSDLFTKISTLFGVGNGTTTFNVPDFRGRVPGGVGQGTALSNRLLGASIGAETHTLSVPEIPAHTHTIETIQTASQNAWGGGDVRANSTTKASSSTGGGGAHNNMQPTLFAGNWFIKVL